MPLTVENGTGLAMADSYVSLAEANEYAEARGYADWVDADAEVKEQKLREATQYIDTLTRWKGMKLSAEQALEFPRKDLYDWSGYLVQGLPWKVKRACMELARKALSEVLDPDLDRGGQIASESVGPVSVSYMPGAPVGRQFRAAFKDLEPFMREKNALYMPHEGGPLREDVFSVGMHDTGDPT